MAVGEICVREADAAEKSLLAVDAARLMRAHRVSGVATVEYRDGRKPIGIVDPRKRPESAASRVTVRAGKGRFEVALPAQQGHAAHVGGRRAGTLICILTLDGIPGLLAGEMTEPGRQREAARRR